MNSIKALIIARSNVITGAFQRIRLKFLFQQLKLKCSNSFKIFIRQNPIASSCFSFNFSCYRLQIIET